MASRIRSLHAAALSQSRLLVLVAPALLAAAAGAQTIPSSATPEDPIQLDPLVVTDQASTQTTLPVRPVRALYGYDVALQDVPRSITQINPEQFETDLIGSFSDFTRYSPSVNQATGQLDNYGSPSIRGALADVYQNGVRMLVRQSNNRPFTLNAYEAADIVAGPAPVIYGPSARTAGYVNYITKKPYFDRQHTTLSGTLGKWYADGSGFSPRYNWTVDNSGPILKDKLAYRVSYQGDHTDSYYDNVYTRFHDVYGTLGWVPSEDTAVDWNFEYGSFDWAPNTFQNRVTQDLIDDGTYLAGPATPIIQVGSNFYSPTLDSSGATTGWIRRTRVVNANGTNAFRPGAAVANPTSNTTAGAGTLVGWVLDPALVHEQQINRSDAVNSPENDSKTRAFNTQLRAKHSVNEDLTLLNNTIYQYYLTDNPNNGGVYNWIESNTVENRTEIALHRDYAPAGLRIGHNSNTGFSYRFEEVKNYKDRQRSGYDVATAQTDLTADDSTFTRNALFGAQVYPFLGNINTPVLTRYGYLKGFWTYLPVRESPDNASSPGGSATGTPAGSLSTASNHTFVHNLSGYTQHSFNFADNFIWDVGARQTIVWARIQNPLSTSYVAGNDDIGDTIRTWVPTLGTSLSYKPHEAVTTYVTYNRVQATNGMTSGSVTWKTVGFGTSAVPNQLDPADFDSLSELYEAGFKSELVRNKLFFGGSVFHQTRDLSLALPSSTATEAVQARGLYEGIEFNLRYQPIRAFNAGLNYSYLEATFQDQPFSVSAPFVADNQTNYLSSTTSVIRDYRITNLPRNNVTAYTSYTFSNGFGIKADVWWRDAYNVTADGAIQVPAEYNINLGFFYDQPRYRVSLDFQNLTNELNHAGGNAPLEPLNAQLRVTYRL